jgi:hypothetical protein
MESLIYLAHTVRHFLSANLSLTYQSPKPHLPQKLLSVIVKFVCLQSHWKYYCKMACLCTLCTLNMNLTGNFI